jgi:hypothetical protein
VVFCDELFVLEVLAEGESVACLFDLKPNLNKLGVEGAAGMVLAFCVSVMFEKSPPDAFAESFDAAVVALLNGLAVWNVEVVLFLFEANTELVEDGSFLTEAPNIEFELFMNVLLLVEVLLPNEADAAPLPLPNADEPVVVLARLVPLALPLGAALKPPKLPLDEGVIEGAPNENEGTLADACRLPLVVVGVVAVLDVADEIVEPPKLKPPDDFGA